MNTAYKMNTVYKIPMIAATLLLMLGSAAGAAQAGERHVARSHQGPHGGSASVQRDRGDGLYQRSVQRQGPAGRSLETQRSRSYDPQTGTYQGSASRTVTGVDGQSASRSREVTREDGQATVTRQLSGPNGQTLSRSRSVERSDQGVTVNTQATGPQGGSLDRSVTYSPAAGG